jgi:hypothetical protein
MPTGMYTSAGNKKLGKNKIGVVNRENRVTCPGLSDFCEFCYVDDYIDLYPNIKPSYRRELELPAKINRPAVRIHASGDFDTVDYIELIHEWVREHPDTLFWAYTRSWRVAGLLPALEALRAEPNVQLFASTDATIAEPPPEGWRVAFIVGDDRYSGPTCMEQTGAKPDCAACGFCFKGQSKNVGFALH